MTFFHRIAAISRGFSKRLSSSFSRLSGAQQRFHEAALKGEGGRFVAFLVVSGSVPAWSGPSENVILGPCSAKKGVTFAWSPAMDRNLCQQFFLQPSGTWQRRYEALRAVFVDEDAAVEVAERLELAPGTVRNWVSQFGTQLERGDPPPFFRRRHLDVPRTARA
jgi:hypothetical protein